MNARYSTDRLENTACPICTSNRASNAIYAEPPFSVVSCLECGLYYLTPRLAEASIEAVYRSDAYFDGEGYADYDMQGDALSGTFRDVVKRIHSIGLAGGRLLEVGCADGYFLKQARGRFSRIEATEYSEAAANRAALYSDEIHLGGLDEIPRQRRYDLIVAFHVFEHVYEPLKFLRKARALLTPDGHILIAVPPIDSKWRVALGRRWPSWKVPEHVVFFDRKSLPATLEAAGFFPVRRVRVVYRYPLAAILQKLGLPDWTWTRKVNLPIPGTTLAWLARNEGED